MTELQRRLDHLGLSQYVGAFITEGFDTWDTLLDVQESDLEYLNVKLGHRRKLQRAIAEARGLTADRALSARRKASVDASYRSDDSAGEKKGQPSTGAAAGASGTKRKYRRHPKPDENASERPASAYVIFSNQIREELRGQELSFTEIAKTVGERWQVLQPVSRDAFERQAASAKEKYYAELAEYKKTQEYALYQKYLADFKAKQALPRPEGKRAKLESQIGAMTRSSSQGEPHDRSEAGRSSGQSAADGTHGMPRSNSSPHTVGPFPPPPYIVSAAASPAPYALSHQSTPIREPYSPNPASSPTSTTGHPAYELPHHARSISSIDSRYPAQSPHAPQSAYWPLPMESDPAKHRLNQGLQSPRRSEMPLSTSLPPLVRNDTTVSGESLGGSPAPYQGPVLPPLDAVKMDRILPQPVLPAALSGITTSPILAMSQTASLPASTVPSLPRANPWPALLRASEIARDADLQASRQDDRPT